MDRWFLQQIADLVATEEDLRKCGLPRDRDRFFELKRAGFSDARLARLTGTDPAVVTARREEAAIHPVYKRVDTCAAEFQAFAPYFYSTYEYEPGMRDLRGGSQRGDPHPRGARTASARASSSTTARARQHALARPGTRQSW